MSEKLSFQDVILRLLDYWKEQGCVIWHPHNVQVGAGTMNPATVLRVLGPEPWNVAYIEPSIRPDDGRFGDNPNRMQQHYQLQVILKPDPGNPQELYLKSLEAIGINPREHDIRFVEDNWQSPALGAWGLGWEVWLDGQEITQFTYFQQAGGIDLMPITAELTYGVERLAMYLQKAESVFDLQWTDSITYRDVFHQNEVEQSKYNFEIADIEMLTRHFDEYEAQARVLLEQSLALPAYEMVMKCSHTFNLLDARGAISVTERAAYIGRVRALSRAVAQAYYDSRERLGFPMLAQAPEAGRAT